MSLTHPRVEVSFVNDIHTTNKNTIILVARTLLLSSSINQFGSRFPMIFFPPFVIQATRTMHLLRRFLDDDGILLPISALACWLQILLFWLHLLLPAYLRQPPSLIVDARPKILQHPLRTLRCLGELPLAILWALCSRLGGRFVCRLIKPFPPSVLHNKEISSFRHENIGDKVGGWKRIDGGNNILSEFRCWFGWRDIGHHVVQSAK